MKISTKGRYGLRALADLAAYSQGEPIALAMVAARQKISLNYLEQVFGQLRKAGLVRSIKGPSGGYLLAKPAKDITVKEILEVLEGPLPAITTRDTESYLPYLTGPAARKRTHNIYRWFFRYVAF